MLAISPVYTLGLVVVVELLAMQPCMFWWRLSGRKTTMKMVYYKINTGALRVSKTIVVIFDAHYHIQC